jgi:hypothetical protein
MSLQPTNIQQIGNELAIQWNDNTESYLNLESFVAPARVRPAAASRTFSAISSDPL